MNAVIPMGLASHRIADFFCVTKPTLVRQETGETLGTYLPVYPFPTFWLAWSRTTGVVARFALCRYDDLGTLGPWQQQLGIGLAG